MRYLLAGLPVRSGPGPRGSSSVTTETMPFRHRFVEATPLARGAEGRLFRVRDAWTGRWGALKVASDGEARASILAEFRLLSRLRHPCILESQEVFEDGESFGHLLEYLPAIDPFSLWEAGGEAAIWAATIQSLRALTYLHRQGFVHGDIAPGNILVWPEGDGWRAKLADFGLALALDDASRAGVRGTRGYWAPETVAAQGTFPGSDLYSLAATMHAWIDGRGPWDDLPPAEQLRTLANRPDLPKPRRRVSPELESLYATLGASQIDARRNWDWEELRSRSQAWGPATLVATVSGLDGFAAEWMRWLSELPGGQSAALVLTGRVGSGRRTALGFFMRELAAEGWMSNWTSPLGMLHDRFAASGNDLDPVLAARELVSRTEGRHLVFRWPEHVSDLESRILRAFIAAREDASSDRKTLVLHASGVDTSDDVLEWLRGATRVRMDDWKGPGTEALRSMATDLFALEEGLKRDAVTTGQSPLALVLMKQGDVQGIAEIASEMGRLWTRMALMGRAALSLLADSDLGWAPAEMAGALGGSEDDVGTQLNELVRLGLLRRSFEAGTEQDTIADPLTREAVLEHPEHAYDAMSVRKALELGSHTEDLGLARRLFENGNTLPRYTVIALEKALREGRYEQVLAFADLAAGRDEAFGKWTNEVWSLFLRAAQRAGKYETQVRILRDLIRATTRPGASDLPPSREQEAEAVIHRKALAQALTNLGDWKQAVEECQAIESSVEAGERDRLWAKLQRAETLWQAGRFADADGTYAEVESLLSDSMAEEWLRFAVGRARQHGQRGDMAGVKKYLELARRKAGKERCETDSLYLHTYAGLSIQVMGFTAAKGLAEKARHVASERADWVSYVMSSLRSAAISYGLGNMWDASRQGRDALATSAMLTSEMIWGRSIAFLAYPEIQLANLGSALRKASTYKDLATRIEDRNLLAQASRLIAFLGSQGGWRKLLDEAKELSDEKDVSESSAFRRLCEGEYQLGLGLYESAAELLDESARQMKQLGEKDSEIRARLLLAFCDHQLGKAVVDRINAQDLDRFPPLRLLAQLIHELTSKKTSSVVYSRISSELWTEGRLIELVEWFPVIFAELSGSEKQLLKSRTIGIIQRAASSLDDYDLRREFLEFPRIKRALLLIREN
jgi:serine/threonine protein kinase